MYENEYLEFGALGAVQKLDYISCTKLNGTLVKELNLKSAIFMSLFSLKWVAFAKNQMVYDSLKLVSFFHPFPPPPPPTIVQRKGLDTNPKQKERNHSPAKNVHCKVGSRLIFTFCTFCHFCTRHTVTGLSRSFCGVAK